MAAPLPTLRALSRPLAALGVMLVMLATVVPVVSRADGSFCIGTIGALDPSAWAKPICDHCVVAAAPAPLPPMLPPQGATPGEPLVACVFEGVAALAPETARIRDPPAA